MDKKIEFPFLRLPVELQVDIVELIRQKADLKSLCLVCKELSDVATPFLYYRIELKNDDDYRADRRLNRDENDNIMLQRIQSLLINPANLRFVRVLTTGPLWERSTNLMNRLLPLFRKDHLISCSYSTHSRYTFPTPSQMVFLWASQKHLQKLKLCTHLVPALEAFMKEGDKSRLFKSFTLLKIESNSTDTQKMMCWPLMNIDMRHLRSLSLNGHRFSPNLVTKLTGLFAGGSFINLTLLAFGKFDHVQTLKVTNVPMLESLFLDRCGPSRGLTLPMALPDNFRLKSLTYLDDGRLEKVTPLLAQIRGLESLVIRPSTPINMLDPAVADFARAITMHKETLRFFKFQAKLSLLGGTRNTQGVDKFVDQMKVCGKLVSLSLPLNPDLPIWYYCYVVGSFPSLLNITIYTRIDTTYTWDPYSALELFQASTRLESVLVKGPKNFSDESKLYAKRFVREELEKM